LAPRRARAADRAPRLQTSVAADVLAEAKARGASLKEAAEKQARERVGARRGGGAAARRRGASTPPPPPAGYAMFVPGVVGRVPPLCGAGGAQPALAAALAHAVPPPVAPPALAAAAAAAKRPRAGDAATPAPGKRPASSGRSGRSGVRGPKAAGKAAALPPPALDASSHAVEWADPEADAAAAAAAGAEADAAAAKETAASAGGALFLTLRPAPGLPAPATPHVLAPATALGSDLAALVASLVPALHGRPPALACGGAPVAPGDALAQLQARQADKLTDVVVVYSMPPPA